MTPIHQAPPEVGAKQAVRRINLQDHGQDFLWWDIDADGVVVGCGPFQGWLWVGTRVLNDNIKRGTVLSIYTKGHDATTLNYRVRSVTKVKS